MKRFVALILAAVMLLSCVGIVSAKESTFTDVVGTASEWANDYIEKMVDKNILNGMGNGQFKPERNLTREEFAKVLVLAIPMESKGITSKFNDVVADSWYEGFVKEAVDVGIMKGYSETEFGIGKNIKRCDMALGIARLDKTDEELKAYADKIPATVEDRDEIPEYAKGAMGYCYEKGIFSGDENGNFKPFDNTTRAQIAKVICVYLENMELEAPEEITIEKPSKPLITGDFIQPRLTEKWTQSQWDNHLDELKEAGIDTIIIQWIVESLGGTIDKAYYPATLDEYPKGVTFNSSSITKSMLGKCLKSAEERGIKVFVGLNRNDLWSEYGVKFASWNTQQAEIGNLAAKEIYDLYKDKYPNALAGFYWWFEMYNGMGGKEADFASMINVCVDYLTELDDSLPLLISPKITNKTTASKAEEEWTKFLSHAKFRKGDIIAFQDTFGTDDIGEYQLVEYYSAIKRAVNTKPEIELWVNNELYVEATWSPAPISKVVNQLEITDKFAEKHICFSYTHYYSTAGGKSQTHHQDYLDYKNHGIISGRK